MSVLRRAARSVWHLVQRVAPGTAARIRTSLARRARPAITGDRRVARLEQDLALMADQVAALTARLDRERGEPSPTDTEVEARLAAARLGAIAYYEERIARLEARLTPPDTGKGAR
jgi:hypothetical protein